MALSCRMGASFKRVSGSSGALAGGLGWRAAGRIGPVPVLLSCRSRREKISDRGAALRGQNERILEIDLLPAVPVQPGNGSMIRARNQTRSQSPTTQHALAFRSMLGLGNVTRRRTHRLSPRNQRGRSQQKREEQSSHSKSMCLHAEEP